MNLNELADEIYKGNVERGFWESEPNFGEKMALVHSEVSEALDEHRSGHRADEVYRVDGKPEGVPIELADVLIRVLDVAAHYLIDMDEAVRVKLEYNASRPYKHGRKY